MKNSSSSFDHINVDNKKYEPSSESIDNLCNNTTKFENVINNLAKDTSKNNR